MIDDPSGALIAEHVRRFMTVMGMEYVHVECLMEEPGMLRISIMAGPLGNMLIGAQGATLHALVHVIRCVLRRHIAEHVRISVDVNGYRVRRERTLFEFATEVAKRAQRTGRPVALSPMSAIDRRIIHMALKLHKDVLTESTGDGIERRVVVRPVFL